MKNRILLLLCLLATACANAQLWKSVGHAGTASINSIAFPACDTGYALSYYELWKTTDGGKSWTRIFHVEQGIIMSIFFLDARTGWIAGGGVPDGFVLRTTDRGRNWMAQKGTLMQVHSIWFFNPGIGWAVANDGTKGTHFVYKTVDSGRTWKLHHTGQDYIRYVSFVNRRAGWILGDNSHIYSTVNGGRTWEGNVISGVHHFNFVQPLSGQVLWALEHFTNGLCFSSADGGLTWTRQLRNVAEKMNALHFTSPATGWIAGDKGLLLHTTDSGRHWTPMPRSVMENLNAISFSTPTCGYIGGDNGLILKME